MDNSTITWVVGPDYYENILPKHPSANTVDDCYLAAIEVGVGFIPLNPIPLISAPAFSFNQNTKECITTSVNDIGFHAISVTAPGWTTYFRNCDGKYNVEFRHRNKPRFDHKRVLM